MDIDNKLMADFMSVQIHTAAALESILGVLSSMYILNLTVALKEKKIELSDMETTLEALQAVTEDHEYKHTGVGSTEPQNGSQSHTGQSGSEDSSPFELPDNVTFFKNNSNRKN